MSRLLEQQLPLLMSLIAALAYAFTLAPTISHTDSGELSSVCYTFGIAHPTGYPLFTLLGGVFSHIPLGSPAFMLNVMALLLTAGGVYWWGRALDVFMSGLKAKIAQGDHEAEQRFRWGRISAMVFGGLFLAFSRTWWLQSTAAEVYSLHCFLLGMNSFLLLRAYEAPAGASARKAWLWLAFGLALSFANHLTTIVFLPGIAWLYFRKHGFDRAAFTQILLMLAVFFPVLIALYAWLPIRAGMDPQYAWGNPQGWDAIWHHVSGRQFRVWMFTGTAAFQKNLGAFFQSLPSEFAFAGLLLVVPGFAYLWKFRRDHAVFVLLGFLATVFWASNYSIKDPEPYFMLALMALSFSIAGGMRWIWLRMRGSMALRKALTGLTALVLLFGMVWNYLHVDQRNAWQYEDYARAALKSLPERSLVVSRSWDVFVSPGYYLQSVEGFRPDVGLIDYHMLRDRHWYPDHLRRNIPELAQALGKRLDEWEEVVQDFDLRGKEDGALLGRRFGAVFYGILAQSQQRPVYFSPDMVEVVMNPQNGMPLPPGITLRPEQYFYRIVTLPEFQQYQPSVAAIHPLRYHRNFGEPEDLSMLSLLQDILRVRIRYEQQFGKMAEAATLQGILDGLPTFPDKRNPQ